MQLLGILLIDLKAKIEKKKKTKQIRHKIERAKSINERSAQKHTHAPQYARVLKEQTNVKYQSKTRDKTKTNYISTHRVANLSEKCKQAKHRTYERNTP